VGERTAIAWTDHTFNPWIGCARVSPGCTNCYAEALAQRWGHPERWGKDGARHVTSEAYWRQPVRWDRSAAEAGRPALVFCASQADVFEDRPDLLVPRRRLFDLIERTPHLIWQLLTKRPENVTRLVPIGWISDVLDRAGEWPANVWIGTTVEDQRRAEERIPRLLEVPAPVRFLSCEPLLGPVRLPAGALAPEAHVCARGADTSTPEARRAITGVLRAAGIHMGWRGVDWVIAGGESGRSHRPLELDHARALRRQCEAAGVPFFFKQVGGPTPTAGGHLLDGELIQEFPPEAGR
jgi:protein gp37